MSPFQLSGTTCSARLCRLHAAGEQGGGDVKDGEGVIEYDENHAVGEQGRGLASRHRGNRKTGMEVLPVSDWLYSRGFKGFDGGCSRERW